MRLRETVIALLFMILAALGNCGRTWCNSQNTGSCPADVSGLLQLGVATESKRETVVGAIRTERLRIPKHLILTGPEPSWAEYAKAAPDQLKSNIHGLNDDVHVRYFNDAQCRKYVEDHYDSELVSYFKKEKHGSFRGDICRAAILLREGGFYKDLDVQLTTHLTDLVDANTSFMSSRSAYGGILNALIATTPGNPVMRSTLDNIRKWYRNETMPGGGRYGEAWPLGPVTMQRAIEDVVLSNCPSEAKQTSLQFACGTAETGIRLYSEQLIKWGDCSSWGSLICPAERAFSSFWGAKFGLFAAPSDAVSHFSQEEKERNFIGWPRLVDCHELGCGFSGGIRSL